MEFRQTYSREHLQSLYRKNCLQVVKQQVEAMSHAVVRAASQGNKTSHAIAIPKQISQSYDMVLSRAMNGIADCTYIPTNDDLVEGFKQMFPGCSVTLKDDWVDVRPGVREQKTVIVVDWS